MCNFAESLSSLKHELFMADYYVCYCLALALPLPIDLYVKRDFSTTILSSTKCET